MGQAQIKAHEDASEQDIASFLENGKDATSAELIFSGMDGIRKIVGDDVWPLAVLNINNAIASKLGEYLTDGDKLFKLNDAKYVIGIVSCGPHDAASIMRKVAESLRRRFLGEDGRAQIRIEVIINGAVTSNDDLADGDIGVQAVPAPQPSDASATDLDAPVYLPIWDGQNKILAAYAVGYWSHTESGFIEDEADPATVDEDVALARLDAAAIRETAVLVEDFFANAFAMQMIIQVHYRAFRTATGRDLILNAMRSIPDNVRKVFTAFITGVPTDLHPSVIENKLGAMRPLIDAVAISVDDWDEPTRRLASADIFAGVSLALPPDARERTRLIDMMPSFCRDVRVMRKVACVSQVRNRLEIDDAMAAGMRLISGCGVGQPVDIPGNMVRCKAGDLPYRP